MHFLESSAMKMGRSLDPALDLPVLMMSHPSLNSGNGSQIISSSDSFLLVAVVHCKTFT